MRKESSVDWDAAEAVDPVTRYLQKEQRLETPVARFAEAHATESLRTEAYRSLIPLTAPQKGEQYAFEVNLDQCTGCKACVTACHSLNGLDEHEAWRDVGLMQADAPAAYQQTVTSACHHCADPGCLNGCPVDAYDKDPETGIVHHLDDQCIGCQYCILKCPYDVPKYNKRLGIVRKCDMCHSRLAEGEAPACVQACPNEAIRIVKVPTESTGSEEPDPVFKGFPQGATEHGYTQPTTRYLSKRGVPEAAQAADARALRPQHLHGPLVIMLLLTQFSVGLLSAGYLLGSRELLFAAAASCLAGLMASGAHLGRPLKGWRAFVGWRHSWLSREVIALGAYMPLLAATLLPALNFIAPLAIGVGLVGVFTSVMVYHDTHRRLWQFSWTAMRFYGSSLLAMACGGLALGAWVGDGRLLSLALFGVVAASLFKGAGELSFAKRALSNPEPSAERQSLRLQWGPLRSLSLLRWTGLVGGGLLLPLFLLIGNWGSVLQLTLSLALIITCLTAEIAERMLFFRGVDAPKMPGGVYS